MGPDPGPGALGFGGRGAATVTPPFTPTSSSPPSPTDAPPHVPDENPPTGDYRRTFDLPADWSESERIVLRFDGVESRYKVWLNGSEIGVGTGSRLAQEFDVTDAARPGHNVLAVRVHQWSASSYVEDQDQWWMPGIFRDVTLQARPGKGIDDVWLRTSYTVGSGVIDPEITADQAAYPIRLAVPELDVDVVWNSLADVAPVAITGVEPWSAEVPRLYNVTVASGGGRPFRCASVSVRWRSRAISSW